MNLGNLIKEAGFETKVVPESEFPCIPSTGTYISDANLVSWQALDAHAEELDRDWFTTSLRPYLYDNIYAWIIKNVEHCRIVTRYFFEYGATHLTKSRITGRERKDRDVYAPVKDYDCLAFYLYWNANEDKFELHTNMRDMWKKPFEYKVARNFNFSDSYDVVGFLDKMRTHAKYIPIVIDELNDRVITYSSHGNRTSIKGACILKRCDFDPRLADALKTVKVSPYGYYFLYKKMSQSGEIYISIKRDWTKEQNSPKRVESKGNKDRQNKKNSGNV